MNFKSLEDLLIFAKKRSSASNRVAVVMAEEEHVMQAVKKAYEMGLIAPFLIGDEEKINKIAKQILFPLTDIKILHTISDIEATQTALELLRNNEVDMLMKGLISTKNLLHEIVKERSNLTEKAILSHLAVFESPNYHKPFGLTDAAMNISPDTDEKVAIIKNAVNAFHKLGIKTPKVALLAATEKVNQRIQSTVDADNIKKLHEIKSIGDCIIEGPLALDLAISKEAADIKNISNNVVGNADLLISPELNCGNILYKSLTYFGNAKIAGVILGATCPIILTSRADSEDNKLLSIALAICLC